MVIGDWWQRNLACVVIDGYIDIVKLKLMI